MSFQNPKVEAVKKYPVMTVCRNFGADELTAMTVNVEETPGFSGSGAVATTVQALHPPSRHTDLHPVRWSFSRR